MAVINPQPVNLWVPIITSNGAQIAAAQAAGTYALGPNNKGLVGGVGSALEFPLDPADFTSQGQTANLRIRAWVLCNSVDPAAGAWTFSLAPVTSFNGASNIDPGIGVGAAVASASVTPAPSTVVSATGTAITFPAAGSYALVLVLGAPTAANSIERVGALVLAQEIG